MPPKEDTNKEILDTLNGLVEAVGSGFDKIHGKLDRIDHTLREHGERLERIEQTILAEHARRIESLEHKVGIRG